MSAFHKFLDIIGIIDSEDSGDRRSKRSERREGRRESRRNDREEDGRDFADEGAPYSPAAESRSAREDTDERYRGYARPRTGAQADDEVSNVVEFKNNPQSYSRTAPGEYRQKTVIHYLRDINDCQGIIDDLLNECQVLLNLEDADDALRQRAIDVVYGAKYALRANMRKVSRATYIIAPQSVEVDQTDNHRTNNSGYASNVRSFRS